MWLVNIVLEEHTLPQNGHSWPLPYKNKVTFKNGLIDSMRMFYLVTHFVNLEVVSEVEPLKTKMTLMWFFT